MYVEPRKMVQRNQFAGQKLRHRYREQTYGHQGGKAAGVGKKRLKDKNREKKTTTREQQEKQKNPKTESNN